MLNQPQIIQKNAHRGILPFCAFGFIVCFGTIASAATYALSPDGSAVVRLESTSTLSASSGANINLPGSFSATTGSGPSPTVDSFDAGWRGGVGGAEFTATYRHPDLQPGESINWVQTVDTNAPLGGNTSPYLDNSRNTSVPFYSYTQENRAAGLASNVLNFYDFPARDPSRLETVEEVTWSADLYPVIESSGSQELEFQNGIRWGFTMQKAMVGTVDGTFENASPGSATVTGEGTSSFTWGVGSPSALSFSPNEFEAEPNIPFSLGTLTFTNGVISTGSGATSVDLSLDLMFTNVMEENFTLTTPFSLINTPNSSDPVASADRVFASEFGIGFDVLEGATASAELMAILKTDGSGGITGEPSGAVQFGSVTPDPVSFFQLSLVGFANPTQGGAVVATAVPLPASFGFLFLGAGALCLMRKRVKPA